MSKTLTSSLKILGGDTLKRLNVAKTLYRRSKKAAPPPPEAKKGSKDGAKSTKGCKKEVPNLTLNNGKEMPMLGLGTWAAQGWGTKKKEPDTKTAQAVCQAIDIGYRLIDCALLYDNEKEIGEAINSKLSSCVVSRKDLFIVSKLWNTYHHPTMVQCACEESIDNLKCEYLDMYLMHWPFAYKNGTNLFPKDKNDKVIYSEVDYVDTWKAMEKLVEDGLVKSIGVANFNKCQIERLIGKSKVVPVVNQVECHPYFNQKPLQKYCISKKIAMVAYSPLGSPQRPWAKKSDPVFLKEPKLAEIGKKHNKSGAQVTLRYTIQRGIAVVPKAVEEEFIKQNFDIFDFELDEKDMKDMDGLHRGFRYVTLEEEAKDHKYYPFHEKS